MVSWKDSVIDFHQPSHFRYIKYEILDSYDGHGALESIQVEPVTPPAQVVEFSSESDSCKAEGLLKDGESWESDPSQKGNFPHTIIVDFKENIEFTKITTFSRVGMQIGMPTKFKVFGSTDSSNWQELSSVDILEDS